MSTLRISDAPLLPDVDGTEKIPTGGRGDYAISVDQIKDHIFQDIGKELVGLGNVDNTSDLDKPVSTAQQAALNLKADKTYVDTNLDLKADKTNVYTRSETSLALSKKADLVNGVVPENQIPSSFNDVLEFTTQNLPIVGESGKIYVTIDTNRTWRWGGNQYVEISNGGVSDSTLKLQIPRKIANVDFDGTQNIDIPHNNLKDRDLVGAHSASAILDDSGVTQQEINNKIKSDWVFVEDFGAKPSPFDSTDAFNAALLASNHVMTRGGTTYNINDTLNFNNAGTALFLASGVRIISSLTNKTLFSLNASNCKIYSFGGEVESPEQFIGTQGIPTFGVVRLNENECSIDGVRFKNYYRFCIQINNTTRHTIKRNTFNGNVPSSFYNEDNSNTLSRGAISYDNPPISTEINPYLNVSDNHFMNDVQGVLSGNFGDTGNPYGVRIVNNSFYKFYDHAMYLDGVSADYAIISNNIMIECRRPIVAGGVGTIITGNTFKGLTQNRFFEQYISLRDPVDCIVSNNTLDGYGAGIALQGIVNTKIVGNLISNNTINQTGESSFGSAIRVYESEEVNDNSIINNIIKSYPTTFVGSIFVNAHTVGRNNKVVGNTIHCKSNSHAMYLRNQTGGNFSNNELVLSYDSPSDLVATILSLVNVKKSNIKGNQLKCTDKGANIDLRGIQGDVDTTHNIISGNSFDFSSPSLKSRSPLIGFSQLNTMRDNLLDINSSMSGSFQLGTSNTVFVSNGNITTSSKVLVQPKTSAASLLLAAQGYYIIVSDGGFTFVVGGASPTAVTDWDYVVI